MARLHRWMRHSYLLSDASTKWGCFPNEFAINLENELCWLYNDSAGTQQVKTKAGQVEIHRPAFVRL